MRKLPNRFLSIVLVVALIVPLAARADVKMVSRTSTKMMGMAGALISMMGRSPMQQEAISYIKGDYSRTETENQITIIDLAKEQFIFLNPRDKTYTLMNFDQLKQQIESTVGEMQQKEAEVEKKQEEQLKKWEVLVDTKRPGKTLKILGIPAEELILTLTIKRQGVALEDSGGMVITTEQWLAKEHPGMKEIEAFNKKLAEKFGAELFAQEMNKQMFGPLMGRYPQLAEGLKKLAEETQKIGRVQLRSVTRIALVPPKSQAGEKGQEEEMPDLSKLGKMFGGFGKKLAKQAAAPKGGKNVLMETTQEVVEISTKPVDASLFKIPADYKEAKME